MDHITRGSFAIEGITTLVLDEFDKSLALGFEEEMSFIIRKLTHLRRRVLVSATAATEIPEFTGVQQPTVLDFITETTTAAGLEIKCVLSPEKDKVETLFQLLCYIGAESTLIFCNHREAAERTCKLLTERGIENAFFHGGLEQIEREQTLIRFRNGSVHFLVATDLAARGLDIPAVRAYSALPPAIHARGVHTPQWPHRTYECTGAAYLLMHSQEPLPAWLPEAPPELQVPTGSPLPPAPVWTTLYISGGKKISSTKQTLWAFSPKQASWRRTTRLDRSERPHLFCSCKKGKSKSPPSHHTAGENEREKIQDRSS